VPPQKLPPFPGAAASIKKTRVDDAKRRTRSEAPDRGFAIIVGRFWLGRSGSSRPGNGVRRAKKAQARIGGKYFQVGALNVTRRMKPGAARASRKCSAPCPFLMRTVVPRQSAITARSLLARPKSGPEAVDAAERIDHALIQDQPQAATSSDAGEKVRGPRTRVAERLP